MSRYPEASIELITAAQEDEEQFVALYQMYSKRVFQFVLSRTADVQLAEDLTQETFISVLRKLHTYTPGKAAFSSWLFTIALNHIRMYFRKHKIKTVDITELAHALPADTEHHIEWLDIASALQQLSVKDQELLRMKYLDDVSNKDIAEILNISPNKCGVQIHRALKRLQKYV